MWAISGSYIRLTRFNARKGQKKSFLQRKSLKNVPHKEQSEAWCCADPHVRLSEREFLDMKPRGDFWIFSHSFIQKAF